MTIKKNIALLIISLISLFQVMGVDMDFGVFNYNSSRLKAIKRIGESSALNQQIEYKYNQDGYLIGRELKKGFNKIYSSEIKYDLEKNIILEYFDRYIGSNKIPLVILEYHYDNNKRFIKLIRRDGNIKDNNISETSNMDVEYNNEGDITLLRENRKIATQYIFFPDDGLRNGIESIFKYEYGENKKIMNIYNPKDNNYYISKEYYFSNSLLTKIITHPKFAPEKSFSTNYFTYDKNNNLIETNLEDTLIKNKLSITKIKYEYDEKNRLKKRIMYYPDDIKKNKVEETEEYAYEDGKYVYYPYLLPPKIKMYLTQQYEMTVDKFVF